MKINHDNLHLLRAAVAAKVAYWDAAGALEKSLTDGGEFTDLAAEHVSEQVSLLAVSVNEDMDTGWITLEHLADTVKMGVAV